MRFSQNNMLEKTKKYKKIIVVCIVAILFMVISFIFIYQTYIQKIIYEERLNQMDEVTHQMFLNLEDVMETKWDYVKVQCNIIEAADIRTTEDLSLHMKRITDLYEFADSKITLLAVDDSGKYYTEEGNQGMVRDTYHFEHSPKKINYVSNFMTTNESRMVFLKKLEHPIRLQSGQTINYYGLYQDMHELNEYFGCDAYENNNSVYILDDNGFKLFNSNKVELIKGHNVFTVLKKMQYLHDSSFDKAEKELKEKGVSYSNAILDGTEYFYVLKKMDHAAWNLIFLVPAKYVATNTVRLVKLIIWFIILFAVVAAGCMIKGIVTVLRKSQSEAIEIERENNTRLETINTELTQAKRAAEQAFEVANNASQSKSDFLASMSHDIRTPMNAIMGITSLIRHDAGNKDKVIEYVDKIDVSAQHLLGIINDVLDMSKIEAGKTVFSYSDFSILETICNDPQVCRIVDLPVYYELKTNNGNRDYRIQIGGHYMNYNTVYVGMDVHKESFTLCSCKYEDEKASHYQRTPASYKNVLRYLAFLRTIYGEDTRFVCGYEAGCLGYSLYHQLENFNVECVILAPTTMLEQRSKRRIKTDKRDAEIIARSLAQHNYSPVHIPTETDNQTKEFIRMRDDHKAELKKIKQQILSFCLRQGYQYDGSGNWTAKHVKWLRSLKPAGLYKEILDEYLLTYTILTDKLNRLDQRIEELASKEEYTESVSKLTCFLGIKTHTALSVIVEVGDFQRFVSARKFAGYLGLVPGQHSSGDDRNGLGITKAGNTHVRRLLVESAQSYTRGKIGYKSRVLRSRQAGNSPQVINYADRANERLRRRYYKMVLKDGKKYNIAKTAIARELACFIWGMMTDNIY